jgi:hypothetical protein
LEIVTLKLGSGCSRNVECALGGKRGRQPSAVCSQSAASQGERCCAADDDGGGDGDIDYSCCNFSPLEINATPAKNPSPQLFSSLNVCHRLISKQRIQD